MVKGNYMRTQVSRASSRTAKRPAAAGHRVLAGLVAVALTLGGLTVAGLTGATVPEAEAAAVTGTLPVTGWYLASSASPKITGPTLNQAMKPIDDQTLYGVGLGTPAGMSGTAGWIGAYATGGVRPTDNAVAVLAAGNSGSTNLGNSGEWLLTMAVDAGKRPNGGKATPYAYFWPYGTAGVGGSNFTNLARLMGTSSGGFGGLGTNMVEAIYRFGVGDTEPRVSAIPRPGYFESPAPSYNYWSGGEVFQGNGKLYFTSGECAGINNAFRMMIFDPANGSYNYSGPLQAATPSDDIFGTGNGCGGVNSYVASDMALDGNGHAYIVVNSNAAVASWGVESGMKPWLVRVVPSTTNGGTWRYNLVQPILPQPGSAAKMPTSGYYWGMAFYNGMLYAAAASGSQILYQINPMTGYLDSVPAGKDSAAPGPQRAAGVFDLASGQTAFTIHGRVVEDKTSKGRVDPNQTGVSGVEVALYMRNPNNSTYTYQGSHVTDGRGDYSFLTGGPGTYVVRLVRPQLNGVNAVQTWADGGGQLNPVVAQCVNGDVTSTTGGPCGGAAAMPAPDPMTPTDPAARGRDTRTQPAQMAIYSTVTVTDANEVANVDFGITVVGSYGDASAGPSAAGNFPVHLNGVGHDLYLGTADGQIYRGPATNNWSHDATDDGLSLPTYAGVDLPLDGTVLAGTRTYTLSAQVSGADAADGVVKGWWTVPGTNSWGSGVWSPPAPPGPTGLVTAPFQVQSGGVLGASGQLVQFRAVVSDASAVPGGPTNADRKYQATGSSAATMAWATPGEIEDYAFVAADAVYRVAATTTGNTATFTIDDQDVTVASPGSVAYGLEAEGAAAGVQQTIQAVAPPAWSVVGVRVVDTQTGAVVTGASPSYSANGSNTTIQFTPQVGDDLTVELTFAKAPDKDKSFLTLSPLALAGQPNSATAPVGASITATASVADSDGNPLPGIAVTFGLASLPASAMTDAAAGGSPTTTCVTGDGTAGTVAGQCSVFITTTVAGTYPAELAATVPINGVNQPLTDSPADVTFTATAPCAANSALALSPAGPIEVGPAAAYTATTTVRDCTAGQPNLVPNAWVSYTVFKLVGGVERPVNPAKTKLDAPRCDTSAAAGGDYGTCSVRLTSTDAGSFVIHAQVDDEVTGAPADVADSPATRVYTGAKPALTCDDGSANPVGTRLTPLDGSASVGAYAQVTAYVTDSYCNALANVPVSFGPTSGLPAPGATVWQDANGSVAHTGAALTDANGQASVWVVDSNPNVVTIPATYPADGAAGGAATAIVPPAQVSFANTGPNPATSTLTVDRATAEVPGPIIATATARGDTGAPVAGVTIDFLLVSASGQAVIMDATGSAQTSSCVTADGGGATTLGQCSVRISDHRAETVTVRGLIGGVDIGSGRQPAADPALDSPKVVHFSAGPVDPAASTFTMAPTALNVGQTSTATITLLDAYTNPVDAVTVTLTPDAGGATFVGGSGTCVSGASGQPAGVCVIAVTNTRNETVSFAATVASSGAPAQIGQPIAVTWGHGAVSAADSFFDVQPRSQTAGSPVKLTLTIMDDNHNPIDDLVAADFVISATSPGLANASVANWSNLGGGVYTVDSTSSTAGGFSYAATVGAVVLNGPTPAGDSTIAVSFVAGDICVSNCLTTDPAYQTRFAVLPGDDGAYADGLAANAITAYAFDTYGNPVADAVYTLTDQTSGANTGRLNPPATTGSTGPANAGRSTFTTTSAGTYTLSGTFATSLGDLAPTVNPSPQISFVPTDAAGGSITIERLDNVVGTTTHATITSQDAQANLVGDVTVTVTASSDNVALGSASGTASASCVTSNVAGPDFGTCRLSVSAKLAGQYTLSASLGGTALAGSPAPVNFVADAVCFTACSPVDPANLTRVEVTHDGALADGVDQDIVTAWAYDRFGNPVDQAMVWSTPLPETLTVLAPGTAAAPAVTDANGVARLAFSSTLAVTAQSAAVWIQSATAASGSQPTGSPVALFFATGRGDPARSHVTIDPAYPTAQPVDASFTITAIVHDTTDNPVAGVAVNFTPDPGVIMTDLAGNAVTACMTGDGGGGTTVGQCQVEVTAVKADTYSVGATIANAGGSPEALQASPVRAVFTAGPICVEPGCVYDPGVPPTQRTHVAMTTNDQPNDGSSRDVATAVASDKHGNPITGAVFAATTAHPMTIVQPVNPTSEGTTQLYFTSATAGSFDAAVTVENAAGVAIAVPGENPLNVRFGTGQFDPDQSSFTLTPKLAGTATPLTVGAEAVNTYTITATTKDAAGGPAGDVGVQFALTPAGTTWISGNACVTDAATGTCSVEVSSTKAGTFALTAAAGPTAFGGTQSAIWRADAVCAVGCTPGPTVTALTHVTLTTDNATADGLDQDIVTVYAYDQWGNPVPGVIVKANGLDADLIPQSGIAPTQADGTTTVFFTTTKAGEHQADITVDVDDQAVAGANPVTMTFRAGAASASASSLTTDATAATVGGQVTATATVRDAHDNLVPNVRVTFATTGSATAAPATCTTAATVGAVDYGTCSVRVSDNVAETTTLTATIPVGASATETLIRPTAGIDVTFRFGDPDPAHSNLTVNPTEQTAGVDVTVTLTTRDAQDNAITNLTVDDITVTGRASGLDDLVMRSFTNNLDGTYSFQTTSRLAGGFTLAAIVKAVVLTQQPTVSFVAGAVCVANCSPVDPTHVSRFEVVADGAQADGVARDTVEAWAYDSLGNPVAAATVVLTDQTTTPGLAGHLAQSTPSPLLTGADGRVLVDFTAVAAGWYTLQGEINGLRPTGNAPATGAVQQLSFVPGNVDAAHSTLELDRTTVPAGQPITATVTTRDAQGSLVGGVAVALSATPSGVTLTTACVTSTVAGADFGTCVVPFTSDLAKTYQVSATIGGVQVGGNGDLTKASPQSVTFTPGEVCFSNCHPVDDPDTPEVDESVTNFSHVEVIADGALADNTATNLVEVFAYDNFGNPVAGATVTSAPLNAPNLTVLAPATPADGLTQSDGRVSVGYISTSASSQQATVSINGQAVEHPTDATKSSPVTLTFAEGQGDPARSRVEIAPTTAQPADSFFTITATVNDSTDNPVGGVVVSFVPDPAVTVANLAGAPTLTCLTADGTAGTTKGVCQVTITTTLAGSYQVGATIPNASGQATAIVGSPLTALFTPGDICVAAEGCTPDPGAAAATVVMTIDGRPGDGGSHNVATVSAYDRHGNPVDGAVVTAVPTSSTTGLTVQPAGDIAATNAQGQSTVWFTANAHGVYAADVTVGGKVPNGSPLTMRFGDGVGDAAHASFAITPAVPGTSTPLTVGTAEWTSYQVTATVNDRFDRPAAGALVIFQISPAGPAWANGEAQCVTGGDGTCVVMVSSIVAGSFNVTASLNGEAIEQAKPAAWKADGVCADDCVPAPTVSTLEGYSFFAVTQNDMVANGVQFDQVTVYARDQYGNPVPGVVVASAAQAGDASLLVGPSVGTNDQGVAVLRYASTVAGWHHATITADGHPVADSALDGNRLARLNFVPGAADPATSTLSVNPTTSPAGTAVVATLTLRDAQLNLVPNATGTFAVTGSATVAPTVTAAPLAGDATCVTGATVGAADYGQCQVLVNDVVAETVRLTSTIPVGASQALVSPTTGLAVSFTSACLPGIDPGCDYDDAVANDRRSRVNVTVDHQPIVGGTDIAKVWLFDAHGNPVPAAQVTTTTADAQLVVPTGQPKSTGADGTVELGYTTTVADNPLTAQAKVFIANSLGETVELVFQPQPGTSPTDPVWNVAANSSALTLHFTDTVSPGAPVITSPPPGTLTNQNPLPLTGTGKPGATVQVFIDGLAAVDANGDPITTTVDANGDWSVALPIIDGTHTITAGQTDPSGNASPHSTGVDVTIDTVIPGAPQDLSGNNLVITGQVPGPIKPGETVVITYPTTSGGTGVIVATVDPAGGFAVATPADAADSGELSAVTIDPAGNRSEPGSGTIDRIIPGQPEGLSGNDLVITGWVPGPIKPGEQVVVTYPVKGGGTNTVTGEVKADGSFSIPTPEDAATSGDLSALTVDPHGNRSEPGDGTLDRNGPAAPQVDPTNGSTITGTTKPNSVVAITDGHGQVIPGCENVTSDALTGAFACSPTDKLDPGTTVLVAATDDHGNASATTAVTVAELTVAVDKPKPNPGEVVSVTGEHFNPGEKVTITLCSNCVVVGEGVADSDGRVVVTATIPADTPAGRHTITATGERSGATSTTLTVVAAPKAPTGGAVVASPAPIGWLAGWLILALAALVVAALVMAGRQPVRRR